MVITEPLKYVVQRSRPRKQSIADRLFSVRDDVSNPAFPSGDSAQVGIHCCYDIGGSVFWDSLSLFSCQMASLTSTSNYVWTSVLWCSLDWGYNRRNCHWILGELVFDAFHFSRSGDDLGRLPPSKSVAFMLCLFSSFVDSLVSTYEGTLGGCRCACI